MSKIIVYLINMDNTSLEKLRDMAFEVTIDPNNHIHAASVEDVVKVLNAYVSSYKSYIEIKLKSENKPEDQIKDILNNTQLLVVNTEFNSYHNSLAPYNPTNQVTTSLFNKYKTDILEVDIDNYSDLRQLREHFTKEELSAIYSPIFNATSKNYNLKIKTDNGIIRKVKKPTKSFETYFKPTKIKEPVKKDDKDKIFQVFVQSHDLKSISKKDIIYSTELEHETYPHTVEKISYHDKDIYLHESITCEVEFKDDLYFIIYSDLNIEVWGQSRKEAIEAFNFTFYSLVMNYAQEEDDNLTDDAIILKSKLNTMIRLIK